MIALSRLGAQLLSHRNEIDAAGGVLSKIEAACKRFDELEGYLYSNIGSLTDYGRAWRQCQDTSYCKKFPVRAGLGRLLVHPQSLLQ